MAMLSVFVLASFETVMPLGPVIQRAGELAAAARRLFELIDAEPPVKEPTHAPAAGFSPVGRGAPVGLAIRGLHFRYAPHGPWVIDNLSMDIGPGGRLGISGPSGVGQEHAGEHPSPVLGLRAGKYPADRRRRASRPSVPAVRRCAAALLRRAAVPLLLSRIHPRKPGHLPFRKAAMERKRQ